MTKVTKSNPRGAGRKPVPDHLKRLVFNSRIPKWLIEEIENRGISDQSWLVETAIIEYLKVSPPDQ